MTNEERVASHLTRIGVFWGRLDIESLPILSALAAAEGHDIVRLRGRLQYLLSWLAGFDDPTPALNRFGAEFRFVISRLIA